MDGHDKNDAAGSADNLDKSNASGTAKGIFSTPDLTVNTENLPQNQPVKPASSAARFNFGRRANRGGANAESSERVASAFAQTDASQQSQRLNEAMLENANAATQSTATGDIQLDAPKKRKKWPIVLLLVLAVVAAVVAVVVFFVLPKLSESSPSKQEQVVASYNKYVNDLKFGSEEVQQENSSSVAVSDWMLFNVFSENMSSETQEEFFTNIENSYTDFLKVLKSNVPNNGLDDFLSEYKTLQDVVIKAQSRELYSNNLLRTYTTDGAAAAYTDVQDIYREEEVPQVGASILSALKKYLDVQLTIIEIYNAQGCITDNQIDASCEDGLLSNVAYQNALASQEDAVRTLERVANPFFMDFANKTNQLSQRLRSLNYE